MSAPKNCPSCRSWIKSQTDEAVRCNSCGRTMRLSARLKISHHKRTGPWETPKECRGCERGEKPPVGAKGLPDRKRTLQPKKLPERKKAPDFTDIADGILVESRIVASSVADYSHSVPDGSETRQVHLEHHMASSPHSQVGQVIKGRSRPQSPTAFDDGNGSFTSFLAQASVALYAADPARTREFRQGNKIKRLTLLDSGRIELTIIKADPGPNGHEIVTSYDSIEVTDVIKAYGSKK